MVNISYLEVPKGVNKALKDCMYYTAQNLYKNKMVDFFKLHRIVSSDFRQYSPFIFNNNTKKSENWNNELQQLLILDIDDGFTLEEAKERFKRYKYLICTTKSHQVEKKGLKCDRFRIILTAKDVPVGDIYFEYMRRLEILFPFIDKQVNTKTGAFLGFSNCKYWYNDGIDFNFEVLKFKPIEEKKPIVIKTNNENNMEVKKIKQVLNQELIRDILNANGFEVDRNFKLTLRQERTPSTSISRDGLIKDFGSDFSGDIFEVLVKFKNMAFPQALEEVRKYV